MTEMCPQRGWRYDRRLIQPVGALSFCTIYHPQCPRSHQLAFFSPTPECFRSPLRRSRPPTTSIYTLACSPAFREPAIRLTA